MELMECIKGRRSVRKFTEEPVPHTILEEVVGLATYAPTWKNSQVSRYIMVEDKGLRQKIADSCVMGFAHNGTIVLGAPVLVVQTMVTGRSGFEKDGSFSTSKGDRWEVFDAGIAAQTFCLAAHALGLGTVIMGIFDENKVHEVVGVPEGQKVASLIAVGYPAETPGAPRRMSTADLVSYR